MGPAHLLEFYGQPPVFGKWKIIIVSLHASFRGWAFPREGSDQSPLIFVGPVDAVLLKVSFFLPGTFFLCCRPASS